MVKKQTTSPSKEEEIKTAVEIINSIPVIAKWLGFQPDCRPYKPSTPQITFVDGLNIRVNVPLDKELIYNAQNISIQQMAGNTEDKPVFTPLGMRYIIDLFEAVMKNGEPDAELLVPDSDDEDWGDDEETPAKSTPKGVSKTPGKDVVDEEWEDETDQPGVEKPEEDFDEDWS